jgi:hypothetical protein
VELRIRKGDSHCNYAVVLLLASAALRQVVLGVSKTLLSWARRWVRSSPIRKDSYESVRVLGDHQTEVYTPEEAGQATHDRAPWDRNKSEIEQRH